MMHSENTYYRKTYRVPSNRFRYWNYSSPASYFLTICTYQRRHLFGRVELASVQLSPFGHIVDQKVPLICEDYPNLSVDASVVMPNHIHLLLTIMDENQRFLGVRTGFQPMAPTFTAEYPRTEQEIIAYRRARRQMLIPKFIGKLKMQTSKQINLLRNSPGSAVWQPNYHDHIVRNPKAYNNIKQYIQDNPKNWDRDQFNRNRNHIK